MKEKQLGARRIASKVNVAKNFQFITCPNYYLLPRATMKDRHSFYNGIVGHTSRTTLKDIGIFTNNTILNAYDDTIVTSYLNSTIVPTTT